MVAEGDDVLLKQALKGPLKRPVHILGIRGHPPLAGPSALCHMFERSLLDTTPATPLALTRPRNKHGEYRSFIKAIPAGHLGRLTEIVE